MIDAQLFAKDKFNEQLFDVITQNISIPSSYTGDYDFLK